MSEKDVVRRTVEEGEVGDPWKPRSTLRPNLTPQHNDAREHIHVFEAVTIAALAYHTIAGQPRVPFRPDRLVIPSNVAPHFTVVDVQIGALSQFALSASGGHRGELPALVFTEQSFGVRLKMDTCMLGREARLTVRNITHEPQSFMAALVGMEVL